LTVSGAGSIVRLILRQGGLEFVENLRRLAWRLGVCGVLMFAASEVGAQSSAGKAPDADLSRVVNIRVTASQITPDAVSCGLSLNDVVPRIGRNLEADGLVLVKEPTVLVTLSLMTTQDKGRGICASTAMLGTYELVTYFDARAGWNRTGYVVLWQRGNQVISPIADHPEVVDRTVSRLTRLFLDSWHAARTPEKTATKKQN
jgi:hypothetical protein